MKPLRDFLDKLHPQFTEGKLKPLYPIYEAFDTFAYTPGETTGGASHVRDGLDLKRMMITVVFALIPCILMAMYNTGYQANAAIHAMVENGTIAAEDAHTLIPNDLLIGSLRGSIYSTFFDCDPSSLIGNFFLGALFFVPVFLVCNAVGGLCEVIFCCIRGHDLNEGFLVTGMLFPLTLPPTIPLWQVALGIAFGVVIGKEVFGGTGKNFLNPALTARAFLYFAYPNQIVGDTVWTAVDGFTGATPLGALANAGPAGMAEVQITWAQAFLGFMPGSMGETSTLCCLIGAMILIATGIGSWRIMAGVLIGAMTLATFLHYGLGPTSDYGVFKMPPSWHLVTGGLSFGLVFMATDPVSAAMTTVGRWYYGLLIGFMTILVRVINPAFPEGIMLAILFGNVFAPLIDYFVVQANIKRRLTRNAA